MTQDDVFSGCCSGQYLDLGNRRKNDLVNCMYPRARTLLDRKNKVDPMGIYSMSIL